MDTRLRIQTILLSEKMKQNKGFSETLGLTDCSGYINKNNKRKRK